MEKVIPPLLSDVELLPPQKTYSVFTLDHKSHPMETTVCINKQKLVMEVDTGVALSLISQETYSCKFSNLKLKPTDVQLRTTYYV